MKDKRLEGLTAGYELPRAQDRQPLDRAEALTLQYDYRKKLREARKPNLYGPGIEFYEEERIRIEQERGW